MKTWIMMFVAGLMTVGAAAQAASKTEIWDLLQRIDGELRYYDQSPQALAQAQARLEEALRVLRGGADDSQSCLDFAYEEYRKDNFSNSVAMEKARNLCRKIESEGTGLAALLFFYESLKGDGYSSATALQFAAEIGRGLTERDLPCVRTAFDRYLADGYSSRVSLERAVEFCRR